jgi:DNA-binding CsgD family transcriptional regulator
LTGQSAVEVVGAVLGLSAAEQGEVWRRWRRGQSLRLIARQLGKRVPSVRAFVLQTGGVQPHSPRRAQRSLSMAEREEISRGVAAGEPCRQIAARLGRAPSTVSRELVRNGGRGRYRAQVADAAAFRRAQRPKPGKLVTEPRLRTLVEAKLALRWSPQQIAGWLPLAYPQDSVMRVAHETIYLSLFVQSRGALRRELQRCLRTGRAMRYPRGKRLPRDVGSCATPSTSASDPPRRPTGRCPAIGKATWSSASGPARSGPWSSATAARCCCSHSLTGSPPSACGRP